MQLYRYVWVDTWQFPKQWSFRFACQQLTSFANKDVADNYIDVGNKIHKIGNLGRWRCKVKLLHLWHPEVMCDCMWFAVHRVRVPYGYSCVMPVYQSLHSRKKLGGLQLPSFSSLQQNWRNHPGVMQGTCQVTAKPSKILANMGASFDPWISILKGLKILDITIIRFSRLTTYSNLNPVYPKKCTQFQHFSSICDFGSELFQKSNATNGIFPKARWHLLDTLSTIVICEP